jgi:hypothetical protein
LNAAPVREFRSQAIWETRRAARAFMRRFGAVGFMLLACLFAGAAAWVVEQRELRILVALTHQLAAQQDRPSMKAMAEPGKDDGQTRLQAFEDQLLAHEAIPRVVQDLMNLADDARLSIVRGEYRPQADLQGRFMRYRMTLPVKGDAQAVHGFMHAALRAQRMLALESVQFKRERIDSPEVEARIQWVVLTRLPAGDVRSAPAETAGPE